MVCAGIKSKLLITSTITAREHSIGGCISSLSWSSVLLNKSTDNGWISKGKNLDGIMTFPFYKYLFKTSLKWSFVVTENSHSHLHTHVHTLYLYIISSGPITYVKHKFLLLHHFQLAISLNLKHL